MPTMRVTLRQEVRIANERMQPNATIEVDDKLGKQLLKNGRAIPAEQGPIFAHEDEMTFATRRQAHEALDAADAAGGPREVIARSKATAPFRGFKQEIRPIITEGPLTGLRQEI